MKTTSLLLAGIVALASASCNHDEPRYLDLSTNQPVDLQKDDSTGLMIARDNGKPVDFYVDTKSHDTIYAKTGKVVNGHIAQTAAGTWEIKSDDDEYKAVSGDTKIKSEGDEGKVKDGGYTRKVEGDGDVKIETGSETIKVDGETGERKVKKDKNITDKVKKIFKKD
jgi:hypothetical protein